MTDRIDTRTGPTLRQLIALLAFACVIASLSMCVRDASAAEEAQTHVFDATLSLTGNCEVSKKDEIADPDCPAEPAETFAEPYGVALDAYGDTYYYGHPQMGQPVKAFVFDPTGHFMMEVPESEPLEQARSLAVDAEGNLYIRNYEGLYVMAPTTYNPEVGEIAYGNAPTEIATSPLSMGNIAVIQSSGRLLGWAHEGGGEGVLDEISSYTEGNSVIRTFGGELRAPEHIAVDDQRELIYVSEDLETEGGAYPSVVKKFDFEGNLLDTMTGAQTAGGFHKFIAPFGELGVAVDESTGHLFVSDFQNNPKAGVYEVTEAGEAASTIEHFFQATNNGGEIAVDNGIHSPNSSMNPEGPIAKEENPNGSYLWVPSGSGGTGHLFAFAPKRIPKAPLIEEEDVTGVSTTEAVMRAKINPNGLSTNYRFESVAESTYLEDSRQFGPGHGFDHAAVYNGTLSQRSAGIAVSQPLFGLLPGTAYRFRVVASNGCEGDGKPACETIGETVSFATFGVPIGTGGSCPNEATRTLLSASLPDCRAYELVTPSNTNGHAPSAPTSAFAGPKFGTPPASADGNAVGFLTIGGAIPGYPGAGGFNGDPYLATRTSSGWETASVGPSGTLSTNPISGGYSPDLRYTAWETGPLDSGTLAVTDESQYIHYPDGTERPTGQGSLGTDLTAAPAYISPGASHTIFRSKQRLEPDAPPAGTGAIYDRTADGVTHVVSLLPGGVPPAAGQRASYRGSSVAGDVVAFGLGEVGDQPQDEPLYVRIDNARTLQVALPGTTFQGLSEDGRFVFYLAGGDLYRFDTQSGSAARVSHTGDVTVINIPGAGGTAYFESPSVATATPNPTGATAVVGGANIYYWDGTAVHFVATVTARDMEGEFTGGGGSTRDALGLWTAYLSGGSTAVDPSRTTADGNTMVFESGAGLTGYPPGASEIYRYSASEGSLICLSCNPTRTAATGDSRLEMVAFNLSEGPLGPFSNVPSLSANGKRTFFESPNALVPADQDGVRDVYEWEANGEGTCATAGGCVFLISSGQSAHNTFLYGASSSGNDVFIYTTDLLTPQDTDETPSVYDVRVGGGFPPPPSRAAECLGEACQPPAVAPADPTPSSLTFRGIGNVRAQSTPCHRTKRKQRKGTKARCIRKHHKKHKHHRRHKHRAGSHHGRGGNTKKANSNRRTAR